MKKHIFGNEILQKVSIQAFYNTKNLTICNEHHLKYDGLFNLHIFNVFSFKKNHKRLRFFFKVVLIVD